MPPNQQLARWVAGESLHNGATPEQGECCPDFSCCRPALLWPEMTRLAFLVATDAEREHMMAGAVGALEKR